MLRENCWEFKKCGREPGGENVAEFGVCPTCIETKQDGVNEGRNAGRICWVIAGTFCAGKVQGTFAEKVDDCRECDFFMKIIAESNSDYHLYSIGL